MGTMKIDARNITIFSEVGEEIINIGEGEIKMTMTKNDLERNKDEYRDVLKVFYDGYKRERQ